MVVATPRGGRAVHRPGPSCFRTDDPSRFRINRPSRFRIDLIRCALREIFVRTRQCPLPMGLRGSELGRRRRAWLAAGAPAVVVAAGLLVARGAALAARGSEPTYLEQALDAVRRGTRRGCDRATSVHGTARRARVVRRHASASHAPRAARAGSAVREVAADQSSTRIAPRVRRSRLLDGRSRRAAARARRTAHVRGAARTGEERRVRRRRARPRPRGSRCTCRWSRSTGAPRPRRCRALRLARPGGERTGGSACSSTACAATTACRTMGSRATATPEVVDPACSQMKRRDLSLFFLDSRTTPFPVVPERARCAGVPFSATISSSTGETKRPRCPRCRPSGSSPSRDGAATPSASATCAPLPWRPSAQPWSDGAPRESAWSRSRI